MRFKVFAHELFPPILEMSQTIKIALFFDFYGDFIKQYSEEIADKAPLFMEAMVKRIQSELSSLHAKGEKTNLVVQKCWNCIQTMCMGVSKFLPDMADAFEALLLPLYEYVARPDVIDFEDDIVMVLKQFIRKTKRVSEHQWVVLPQLTNVFTKNKDTFGSLFETLNSYLTYGKQKILEEPKLLEVFIDLGHKSMNTSKASINVHNSEGAIMFQLLLQQFAGTNALDNYL